MKRLFAALLLFGVLAVPSQASAAFGLNGFDVSFLRADGSTADQAGSHPGAIQVSFKVNTKEGPGGGQIPDEAVKDLNTFMIPGFVGNPTAVPPCSNLDFLTHPVPTDTSIPGCTDGSAVGLVTVEVGEEGGIAPFLAPVYLLEPPPGVAAKLGFWVKGVPVTIDLTVSESPPYNVVARLRNVSQVLEFFGTTFTIWGVPASPIHDDERGACYDPEFIDSCPAGVTEEPFLTLPRACLGPLTTSYELDPWQHPGAFTGGSVQTHDSSGNPQGMQGCGKLEFGPRLAALPSTASAESASGIDVDVDVTDEGLTNPTGNAQSDIREIVTALPTGVTLNPSAAEGLGVCTLGQYEAERLVTPAGSGCPGASKLGSVEVQTPILEGRTVSGSVYLAQQDDPSAAGKENPFDSLTAIYLVVREPDLGIFVKQAGEVETDPQSGRILTTFKDIPQFPLSHIHLHLRSGPRAPLVTPPSCGTYQTTATMVPWSGGDPVETSSSFSVNSGPGGGPCPIAGPPPFAPGFEAGSINNAAGAYSPFYLRLLRGDGEQNLTRFSAVLPPGVVGKIAGLGRCSDAAIEAAKQKSGRAELASPSCPQSSEIGHIVAGAGVGTALTYVPGFLYLAGPFGGDPLSIVAIVPAVAGPFDVGTVVTRVALSLNPVTAQVEVDGAASDPIPHILEGIPLKLRDLRVFTDRPNFTLNPTSCEPFRAVATLMGSGADVFSPADDSTASVSTRYQAASCASLPFAPKLSLKLKGGTKRNTFPALRAELKARPGDANIGAAVVTLPHSAFLEQGHIRTICTRVRFAAKDCPAASVYGTARAFTPLLDEPLEGPVYLRANGGDRELPDLVAALHGIVDIEVVGYIDAVNGSIRSSFETVPDAPVTKFVLEMQGGKKGLIVNSANICARTQRAKARFIGQNGKVHEFNPVLANSCKGKGAKKKSGQG